jgi:UBX domain-containing protein 1
MEVDEPESDAYDDHVPPSSTSQSIASSGFLAGGGRRLGDDSSTPISATSTPISAAAPKSKKTANPQSKITSFKDIRDRETQEEEDDDDEKDQEFYAGGDKSGLAVQEPNSGGQGHNDQVRRLLETARR